jgi:glucuronate isomerase
MKSFLCEDFLLSNDTARRLYHDHAASQPIFDYHCHLNPRQVSEDHQFANMSEIWLAGDHYKWRAMRSAGIDERFITGNATDREKFDAWAKTVPLTMGNPLFHWTHLELRRPFGITGKILSPKTADDIWHQGNELLAQSRFSARGIMKQMNVVMVGTTDDPIDSLERHKAIAQDSTCDIDVLPSWRPDKAFKLELAGFSDYIKQLAQAADIEITNFASFTQALERRLNHFDANGCKAADHGIDIVRYADIPSEAVLDELISRRLLDANASVSELECAQFSTAVQVWLAGQYAQRNWVMQLHMGALRNNNSRMLRQLGPDTGFDSIADAPLAYPLSRLLDTMDSEDKLPKTILYCLNPRDNEVLATMMGNFQGGGVAGKIQFGSGWWFNDQKDGMQRQLEQLSQLGLLSQFIGMLTDSRSFLSYTRHEYFRRILCNMLGKWVEDGELPKDFSLLGPMVENICFNNAQRYFKP